MSTDKQSETPEELRAMADILISQADTVTENDCADYRVEAERLRSKATELRARARAVEREREMLCACGHARKSHHNQSFAKAGEVFFACQAIVGGIGCSCHAFTPAPSREQAALGRLYAEQDKLAEALRLLSTRVEADRLTEASREVATLTVERNDALQNEARKQGECDRLKAELAEARAQRDDYADESRRQQVYIGDIGSALGCVAGEDTPGLVIARWRDRLSTLTKERDAARKAADEIDFCGRELALRLEGVEEARDALLAALGMDRPWPVFDLIETLAAASETLLEDYGYTRDKWEEISGAIREGREMAEAIKSAIALATGKGKA